MSANDDMGDTTADADADAGGSDQPDPSLPGNNEPGEFDPIERGIDAARLQRQRQQLRRRAANEAGSDYSLDDIAVREGEDDRLRAQITSQAREREREEALKDAAEDFDRYTAEDLQVVQQDGERVIQPTETAVERERQETRQGLRQDAVEEIEGVDDPSLIDVTEDGGQLQAELSAAGEQQLEARQRQQLREQVVEEVEGVDDPSLVTVTEDGDELQAELSEEGQEQRLRATMDVHERASEIVNRIRERDVSEVVDSQELEILQASDNYSDFAEYLAEQRDSLGETTTFNLGDGQFEAGRVDAEEFIGSDIGFSPNTTVLLSPPGTEEADPTPQGDPDGTFGQRDDDTAELPNEVPGGLGDLSDADFEDGTVVQDAGTVVPDDIEQQLSSQAIEQIDAVETAEQVDVTRAGDEFNVALNEDGERAVARQRAEQALEAQLGEELEQSDIRLVEEDGETRARLAGRAAVEQANEALIEQNREFADEVSSEVTRLEDDLGTELSPGDYSVRRGEDGEVQVELTESARERVSEELVQGEQQGGESEVFIDDLPEGGLEGTNVQDAPIQATQAPGTTDGSEVDAADLIAAAEEQLGVQLTGQEAVDRVQRERFGDFDWSFGLGGPEDEVEGALDTVSDTIIDESSDLGETLFSEDVSGESAGEAILDAVGQDELGDQYDATIRNYGQGIVSGTGALAAQAPQLVTEVPEFVAFAATNPGETADQLPEAVATRAVLAGQAAKENPAQMAGALTGSLALSAGLFRATQGTRAGSVARWSLQPGEEAVKLGISRGMLGQRAARVTPGVRMGQIEGESETETADAGDGESTTDAIRDQLGSAASRAREAGGEARRQSPGISIQTDPSTGRLDVSAALQRDLGFRADDIRTRALGGAVRAQNIAADAPDAVDRAVRSAMVRAQNAPRDAADAVRQEAAIQTANVDSALVEGAVRAQNVAADAPDAVEQAVRGAMVRAQNAPGDAADAVRQEAAIQAANVDTAVLGGAVRARNRLADARGAADRAVRRALVGAENMRADARDLFQEQAAVQAANADSALVEGAVRAQNVAADAPDAADQVVRGAMVRAQNARRDIEDATPEFGVTAANVDSALVEGAVRAQNVVADAPDAADRAVRRALVGAQNLRVDTSDAIQRGFGIQAANTDTALMEGGVAAQNTAADFGTGPSALERGLVTAQNIRADLGDLGLRIEPGQPSQRTFELDPEDADFEIEVEGQGDDPFAGFDMGDLESEGESELDPDADGEIDAGDGQVAVVQSASSEAEAEPEPVIEQTGDIDALIDAEAELPEPGTPPEPSIGPSDATGFEDGVEDAFDGVAGDFDIDDVSVGGIDSDLDQGGIEPLDVGDDLDVGVDQDVGTRMELDTRTEIDTDLETETETETETESEFEQELEQELESEFEMEMEWEAEAETEAEAEGIFGDEDEDPEDIFAGNIGSEDDLFGTGIADAEDLLNFEQ